MKLSEALEKWRETRSLTLATDICREISNHYIFADSKDGDAKVGIIYERETVSYDGEREQ